MSKPLDRRSGSPRQLFYIVAAATVNVIIACVSAWYYEKQHSAPYFWFTFWLVVTPSVIFIPIAGTIWAVQYSRRRSRRPQ